jgi:hypothetical protein
MEPFNIRISYQEQELTLTILPADKRDFKIVYYNGILAGVRKNKRGWVLIPQKEVAGEELPLYEPKHGDDRVELELSAEVIGSIGREIELYLER